MGKYQGYEKYKDSGVEWLGEIPEHWEIKRTKFFVTKIGSGKTPKGGSEIYVDSGVMLIRSQNVYDDGLRLEDVVYIDDEIDNLQANSRVFPNDILLNITGASIGRVSLVPSNFIKANVNQHVCIFRPDLKKIFPPYLHLLLCSKQGKEQIFSYENGTSREGLNFQQAGNLTFATPPLDEQKTIARFLDYKTKQIDDLIAKKEALIEKLDEKRTALISHAVTKGLDPNVPMKDSGIEWLGEIPKHWKLKRLKFVVSQIIDAEHKTATYDDDGDYLVVRTANVRAGKLLLENAKFTNKSVYQEWTIRAVPEKGDILFTREAPAGEACLVPEKPIVCLGQRMVLFKFNKNKYNGYFLLQSLYSGIADEFIKSLSLGSTVAHFNMSDIGSIPLFIPHYNEQKEIGEYLTEKINTFDEQVKKVKTGIELLKEYRTALITNAVTGKIDVRQVPIP